MTYQRYLTTAVGLLAIAAQASAAGLYSTKTSTATYLPAAPGWTEVVAMSIPTGTWIVQSLAPGVNFNGTDIMRCELTVDGLQVSQSSSMLGGGGGMPAAAALPNLAVVALPYTQTIALSCGHDANVGSQRIDPGTWLVVSRAKK
jgi:hypothetical protein